MVRLERSFFLDDAVVVARRLVGKQLIRQWSGERAVCRIVETEAYIGPEDKACHAYQNRRTKRTEVMFARGGCVYIYLIYGMYYCLNVVANDPGKPEAVLIRAVEPLAGIARMQRNRKIRSRPTTHLTNGPGKLCQALEIDSQLNGYDLVEGDALAIVDDGQPQAAIGEGPRVNIGYAEEYAAKPWRFYLAGNPFVSQG